MRRPLVCAGAGALAAARVLTIRRRTKHFLPWPMFFDCGIKFISGGAIRQAPGGRQARKASVRMISI